MNQSRAAQNPIAGSPRAFVIERSFAAPQRLVWDALTRPEHLVHWFGPKGFKMLTCTLDLRPGGVFHYGMQSPDGHTMWGKWILLEIAAPERLVNTVSFSDENQGVTRHPLSASWPLETLATTTLAEREGRTTMSLRWVPHHASDEERATFDGAHDGMRQGWTGTMDQLDAYLATVRSRQ